VVGFRYAIDPPSDAGSDTTWTATRANRETFTFAADSVVGSTGRRFHSFVVKAVDDAGMHSAPEHVSFDATTIAPTVKILRPTPRRLLSAQLSSSFRVSWTGSDVDGAISRQPAQYRWRLFGPSSSPSAATIQLDPDTLESLFAPSFAQWDSLPSTETAVAMRDLTPGSTYVFAVMAIDEAGAWSPVFSFDENLLQFFVDPTQTAGPKVTLSGSSFTHAFQTGGILLEPGSWPAIDFASGAPVVLGWTAEATPGALIQGMRWAVDIESILDETPRSDETSDVRHWSRWTQGASISIPGLDPPAGISTARHLLYVEVEDDIGQLSLVGLQMSVVRPEFSRQLLVIDDTFFQLDRAGVSGCTLAPTLAWPTAAELDTFLYAVGGVPWRCYPAGTISPPGLFAGYDFDTLGTHTLRLSDFTLARLGQYRNIVWMVDGNSAVAHENTFNTVVQPMPMLRYLSQPGVHNPLITWIQQGGRLWLMGGGASYATLRDFDAAGTASNRFANSSGELVPGRFIYNFVHWRSEVQTYFSRRAQRAERAVSDSPGAPDYSLLPIELSERTPATDPLPPLRIASHFYSSSYYSEHLIAANAVIEPMPGGPDGSTFSALDTLYETQGGISGTGHPVMTRYHGAENAEVVFSGFPIWYFKRSQAIDLVDFVLQRMWGMQRRAVPR